MRKIIQLLYDHTTKAHRPVFLVLCDDGSVWRRTWTEKTVRTEYEANSLLNEPACAIIEPVYTAIWERATEFDQLTNIQAFVQAGMINQQNPLNE